jgi:hypothetical protein
MVLHHWVSGAITTSGTTYAVMQYHIPEEQNPQECYALQSEFPPPNPMHILESQSWEFSRILMLLGFCMGSSPVQKSELAKLW